MVLLVDEDTQLLTVQASDGFDIDGGAETDTPVSDGIAARISAQGGASMVVEDLSTVEVDSPYLRERVRSLLGVPLRVEGQVIGVLHVGTRERRRFSDEDLELLRIDADRVAPAIDRARLFEEVREGRERFLELSRGLVELQEAERRKIA